MNLWHEGWWAVEGAGKGTDTGRVQVLLTGTAHIRPSSRLAPQPCPVLGSLHPLEPVPLASPELSVTRHPMVGRVRPGLLFSGTLNPRWCWGRRLRLLCLPLRDPFFTPHPQPGPGKARDTIGRLKASSSEL